LYCSDIGADTHDWMAGLAARGHLTCAGCYVRVERDVRRWLAATLPSAGALRSVTLLQHSGGWLYQRATYDSGRAIDCRFSGDKPVVVDLCLAASAAGR